MTTPEANRWRALRQITGLSLREIGRRAEINSGRLSIIERGVNPTPDEAERLSRVLVAALPKNESVA
jgi:transcriptional regulator with XRE-family HTH domain